MDVSAVELLSSPARAELEFKRRRIGSFGLVAAGLLFMGLVFRVAVASLSGEVDLHARASYQLHLLATLSFLSLWALTRGRRHTHQYIRSIEAGGLLVGCAAITAMGIFLPASVRPELIVSLALTQGLVARAVYVPSSAPRTLVLAAIVGVPLVLSVYFSHGGGGAWRVAMTTGMWWIATTVTPEGVFYYAMELLEGASLEHVVALDGPQPPERVAYLVDQVAAALSEAHGIGLIHRDIKPANIILTRQGGEPDVAKVVDFGLVKDVRASTDPGLSRTGTIAGTPNYMAPEMILAYHDVDTRSDLYSLGVVAYFLLTGEPVFKGKTAADVCTQHVQSPPVPPSKRSDKPVPADLERLVLALLAKDPARRPQTAGHVRARLWAGSTVHEWNTDRARRWWREHGDALRAMKEPPEMPRTERTVAVARPRLGR